MELIPGFYKIQRGDKHLKSFHYWHVYVEKGELFLKEDHGIAIPINDKDRLESELEGVKIITRYSSIKKPLCKSVKITVDIVDEDGDHLSFASRNKYSFRAIFDALPWIKKLF